MRKSALRHQGTVLGRGESRVLRFGGWCDPQEPSFTIRVAVDPGGVIADTLVDRCHGAADRRDQVANDLRRLDFAELHTSHELTVDWWQEHANHLAEGVLSIISDPWSQDRCAGAGLDPDVLLRVGVSSDMRTMDTADYAAGPNSGAVKNDTEVTNFEPSHDRI